MWLWEQIPPTEEGQQQWERTVAWLNTPPAHLAEQAPAAPPAVAAAPPGTPVTRSQQAAALSAFMGTVGG